MSKEIASLLIGATLTLIGTCLVQTAVVPWVQTRTRQRERWERDVLELTALLEEELPRALNGYRSASIGPRTAQQWQSDAEVDQEKLKALLSEWNSEEREADRVVGDRMARLDVLIRRIRRVHSDASYWLQLRARRVSLSMALWDVEPWRPGPMLDDEAWNAAWDEVTKAREGLIELVLKIADPPKPPPRPALRLRIRKVRRKLAARVTGPFGRRRRNAPELRNQSGS